MKIFSILFSSGRELRSRNKQPLCCLLSLQGTGELLDFWSIYPAIGSPLLCLNINIGESQLILFDHSVNATVTGCTRHFPSVINAVTIPHFQEQLNDQCLKICWRKLHYFIHKLRSKRIVHTVKGSDEHLHWRLIHLNLFFRIFSFRCTFPIIRIGTMKLPESFNSIEIFQINRFLRIQCCFPCISDLVCRS